MQLDSLDDFAVVGGNSYGYGNIAGIFGGGPAEGFCGNTHCDIGIGAGEIGYNKVYTAFIGTQEGIMPMGVVAL